MAWPRNGILYSRENGCSSYRTACTSLRSRTQSGGKRQVLKGYMCYDCTSMTFKIIRLNNTEVLDQSVVKQKVEDSVISEGGGERTG